MSDPQNNDDLSEIVNPCRSTCYDWRGEVIPCIFKRPYAELLVDGPIPNIRFSDNDDGTLTDNLTKLIWLKNMDCFGMLDWQSAVLAAKKLKAGDCGTNINVILSDESSVGDWRLPTMEELVTLIDFSRRNPALSGSHTFLNIPSGYHWSATKIDPQSSMAWIVYFESGTTCYENIKNRAGFVLPVRSIKKK